MPTKKKAPSKGKSTAGRRGGKDSPSLEGRKAPGFALPDHAGNTVKLADLIGSKKLVLYFYPKDLTPGCTIEACSFRDQQAALRSSGAQVVGISGDSTALHEKFRTKYDLNFPLLSDVGNEVGRAYACTRRNLFMGANSWESSAPRSLSAGMV